MKNKKFDIKIKLRDKKFLGKIAFHPNGVSFWNTCGENIADSNQELIYMIRTEILKNVSEVGDTTWR